jgi:hypothetical protein
MVKIEPKAPKAKLSAAALLRPLGDAAPARPNALRILASAGIVDGTAMAAVLDLALPSRDDRRAQKRLLN